MTTLLHKSSGSEQELLEQLQELHIPPAASIPPPGYTGGPKETLDRPITLAEARAALTRVNIRSAPGPDGITNKLLRNITGAAEQALTDYINTRGIQYLRGAQRVHQLHHLASTPTGRSIPTKLEISFATQHGDKISLSDCLRSRYSVAAITPNMNPAFHQERRLARAKALHKAHASHPPLPLHVNAAAAEYPDRADLRLTRRGSTTPRRLETITFLTPAHQFYPA
ncbi:hypothetical protein HPB48_010526 [Haemaphysalis longicornis]|uniref:Uncharacterized protein n=1 Tax=Haemaphysalis longicornis TaxID=44386 RepID=A0A9J6H365_HAELO|nr:hypothetical protein HPB48_010526 [Haemaphysalis longicornis]